MNDYKKHHDNMIRVGRKYTPEEVLQHFHADTIYARGASKVDFDGHLIKMGSHRYWTFAKKGLTCASCGLEGKFFVKEKSAGVARDTYHFNLYGIDGCGDEVLITKDHIIPKSKGGTNHISNYQTMCQPCNGAKGAEYETIVKPSLPLLGKIARMFKHREILNLNGRDWGFFFDMDGGVTIKQLNALATVFNTDVVQCHGAGPGRIRIKVVTEPPSILRESKP